MEKKFKLIIAHLVGARAKPAHRKYTLFYKKKCDEL